MGERKKAKKVDVSDTSKPAVVPKKITKDCKHCGTEMQEKEERWDCPKCLAFVRKNK